MRNIILFQVFFAVLSLCFIPLLASYGLQACPVLKVQGFWVGCYYSGLYVLVLNIINTLLFSWLLSEGRGRSLKIIYLRHDFTVAFFLYALSTAASLLALKFMFGVDPVFSSRAPHVLVLASALLGLTQAYGYNLVAVKSHIYSGLEKEKITWTDIEPQPVTIRKNWFIHISRIFLPILLALVIIVHFILSQKLSMNDLTQKYEQMTTEDLIDSVSALMGVLLFWLSLVFSLYFGAEAKMISLFEKHLSELRKLSLHFKSPIINTWGLWRSSIQQLNDLTTALGEKNRLLKNFSKFVAEDVAQNAAQVDFQSNIGQSRELTVLMIDIRSFTAISEKISPQQVVALLNEYFSVMLEQCAHFSITVDKFIGDGILAYVDDLKRTDQEQKQVAVQAALSMQESLKPLNERLLKMQLPQIRIGIGIDQGPLVIGLIGSDEKLQHTIIGDSVNRAARLEGLNKSLSSQIVISENVWQALKDETQKLFEKVSEQKIAGIENTVTVYKL